MNERHKTAVPELLRELESSRPIRAVFSLRKEYSRGTGEAVRGVVRSLLDRIEKQTGHTSWDISIYESLGAFALEAPPTFIRSLIDQDEIRSAAPESAHESAKIEPKDIGDAPPGEGEKPRR